MPRDTRKENADVDDVAILDGALSAAESHLEKPLPHFTPFEIAERFGGHLETHLETELEGAMRHGNSVSAFRKAVNRGTESAS